MAKQSRYEKQVQINKETLPSCFVIECASFSAKEIYNPKIETVVSLDAVLKSDEWEESISFSSFGKGAVDALVNGLSNVLSQQWESTKDVKFRSFDIKGKFDSVNDSSAPAKVELGVENSRGDILYFTSEANSILQASLDVVTDCFVHLINCERSASILRECIIDAQNRHRPDLEEKYISKLAELVKISKLFQ